MNDFTPNNSGKVYNTIAQHSDTGREFNREHYLPSAVNFFRATPNSHVLARQEIDETFIKEAFIVQVVSSREYLKKLFLENPERLSKCINSLIAYRKKCDSYPAKDIIYGIHYTERPMEQVSESKAHDLGRKLPTLDGQDHANFLEFLEPTTHRVSRGHYPDNQKISDHFSYIALPLLWTLDLAVSKKNGVDDVWEDEFQRNRHPEWWWLAVAFEFKKNIPFKTPSTQSAPYLNCSAYVLGDYFMRLGLENSTPDSAKKFGTDLLRSFDYAATAKTLLFLREVNSATYLNKSDVNKIKLNYDDLKQVLEYPKRLDEYVNQNGISLTKAEMDLRSLVSNPSVHNFIERYARSRNRIPSRASVLNLESSFDNNFTLRENTGTFVKNAVIQGVAKEAGVVETELALA